MQGYIPFTYQLVLMHCPSQQQHYEKQQQAPPWPAVDPATGELTLTVAQPQRTAGVDSWLWPAAAWAPGYVRVIYEAEKLTETAGRSIAASRGTSKVPLRTLRHFQTHAHAQQLPMIRT